MHLCLFVFVWIAWLRRVLQIKLLSVTADRVVDGEARAAIVWTVGEYRYAHARLRDPI
jgi:hypothetical protein